VLKIIYIDCPSGISGEALLGALVDLGIDREQLIKELHREIAGPFNISFQKTPNTAAIRTILNLPDDDRLLTYQEFIMTGTGEDSEHNSPSSFAKAVVSKYLVARSRLEGLPPEEITISRTDAMKTTILAAGIFAALKQLDFPLVISAPVPTGVPALEGAGPSADPLILELAKGAAVRWTGAPTTFDTHLGVAILVQITNKYGQLPEMNLRETGYGAPENSEEKGAVRMLYGTGMIEKAAPGRHETVLVMETSIDDMNPEFFPYLIERLLTVGALDAFLIPVYMKKGRPANLLRVLCKKEQREEVLYTIFKESTTLGVRIHEENRRTLHRSFFTVHTSYGEITVKSGYTAPETEPLQIAPEFEDCKKIAARTGVPLKVIYTAAQRAAFEKTKKPAPEK
jgi:hypothetical protein